MVHAYHVCLHVTCLVLLNCTQNQNILTAFSKTPQYWISWKSVHLFIMYVHTDRHDRASRCISVPSHSDCTKRYSVLSTAGDINMSEWSTVLLSVAWSKCACSISCLWSWEYRMKTNEKLPLINGNCLIQKQERRKDLTKTALMCVL